MTSKMITRGGKPIERPKEVNPDEEGQKHAVWMHIYMSSFHSVANDLGLTRADEYRELAASFRILRAYLTTGGAPDELHEATGFNAKTLLFPWESRPYEQYLDEEIEKMESGGGGRAKTDAPHLTLVRTPTEA